MNNDLLNAMRSAFGIDALTAAINGLRAEVADLRQQANERSLTSEEAAVILGCSPATVRRKAAAGEIPAMRVGRGWAFSRKTLETLQHGATPTDINNAATDYAAIH